MACWFCRHTAVHRVAGKAEETIDVRTQAVSPVQITEAAERGDALANELTLETAWYMGIGAVNIMHVLNPESILFGGAMTFGGPGSPLGEQFLTTVRETVKSMAFPIPVARTASEFATLGNDAGFIGAAAHAARSAGLTSPRQARSFICTSK